MVFSSTFNNISVISWRSVLLEKKTKGPGKNHLPVASQWQTLSHNDVHLALIEIRTHKISGDRHCCIGSCKSNYHTITSTKAPKFVILVNYQRLFNKNWWHLSFTQYQPHSESLSITFYSELTTHILLPLCMFSMIKLSFKQYSNAYQYNDQAKKDNDLLSTIQKIKYWATRTPLKLIGELGCNRKISSSYSINDI